MLLGSVSRYAAMHAACPVIVVREETGAVHREVVVGVRDPLDATAALDFAFGEAALRGATLVAVHSWTSLPAPFWRPADAERLAAETDAILAEALEPWREKYPGVPVRHDVVHGHPARVLAAYAGRADLVVVGRHSRGPAIGGIQHAVLSHAHGPIAIVPETVVVPDPVAVADSMAVPAAG
jgi:nucleotide-binding universal stress UspA family protein